MRVICATCEQVQLLWREVVNYINSSAGGETFLII